MAKQTFTTGQVLTAAQMTSLQQTAMLGGDASAKVASYVLAAADAGTAISMNNAGATTITVNTALFAAGDIVTIVNLGAGVCTITAGTATVDTSGSLALAQNQGGVLRFTSASAAIFFQFATPASGDIEGVTAGTGISGGGTSGTVTITNSMATEIDAKGDLVVGTGADTFARLAVGTDGHTLVADSTVSPTGLKWAAPAAFSGVHLSKSASQSCANNATTTITFDTEQFDTDSYHSTVTNTSRITVATAGYYAVYGEIIFANASDGVRQAWIAKNGSNFTMLGYNGGAGTTYPPSTLSGSDIINLAVNDYIEIQVSQSSGNAINALGDGDFGGSTACRFTLQKLGA